MKREDVEAGGGENLVRYRKEPSGCPVCGKVTRIGAGPGTQDPAHLFLWETSELYPLHAGTG